MTLSLLDFPGFKALGADIGGDDTAPCCDDAHPLDVGHKGALGAAGDLAAGAAFGPGHTPAGDMSADDFFLVAYVTDF